MRRKIVLVAALCLAVAALGIGAAPALAAGGCTCHTDASPTATPAHAPFVASVTDCTTCHVGWTVPHPVAVEPALTARVVVGEFAYAVAGGLSIPWVPLAGVTIYPQMKGPAATEWTTLEPLFGDARIATDKAGNWARMIGAGTVHPPVGTTFRAISQGVADSPVVLPAVSGPFTRPIPTLALRLFGLANGIITRGHPVTARGTASPTQLEGTKAFLSLQKAKPRPGKKPLWSTVRKVTRTVGATGAFTWRFTLRDAGRYRIRATIEGTAAYRMVKTDWRHFRVK